MASRASRTREIAADGAQITLRLILGIIKWVVGIIGTVLLVAALTTAVVICYGSIYVTNVILPQSNVDLVNYSLGQDSVIWYMDSDTGEYKQLVTLNSGETSIWVDYEDIPEDLLNAAVAIEDQRFYSHQGVDWKRTAGAMVGLLTGSSYGGSTITQQLIKNVTQNTDVTVKRKVTEIFQALEFEKSHSKKEILEYYLNIIYLGERCTGVGAAAQAYFGKDVSDLDLAECAALIGITNNPSRYDPLLTTTITMTNEDGEEVQMTHKEANKYRQEVILYQMLEQGYITQEEYDEAVAEELHFVDKNDSSSESSSDSEVFSWFTDALINQVQEDLEDAGYSSDSAKLLIYSGGLNIYATLDPEIQEIVDNTYTNLSNFNYSSSNGQQLQSSITIIDNEIGAVVALAGGVGEKTNSLSWNRATMSKRQPGSAIKPIAVYAPAMDSGIIAPNSVVDDYPYLIDEAAGTTWPKNSYGSFKGLISIKEALRVSSNCASVQILAKLTPESSYEFLTQSLGFTTLVDSRVSNAGTTQTDIALAPLAVGGLTDGMTNIEITGAYETLANGGTYVKPYLYSMITSSTGSLMMENDGSGVRVIKESTAYYMNQMLENVVTNGTGKRAAFYGQAIAGKTGTTTSNYDRWFCGYTPYYTASVWCGYDTNEEITTTTNVSAVIWGQIMNQVHSGLEYRDFDVPGETVTVSYCQDSGKLVTAACRSDMRGSQATTGTFLVGDEPTAECDVHTFVKVCTYAPIYGTGMYKLASVGISSAFTQTISVLDIDRTYTSLCSYPSDYLYTYSWLLSQGYAEYDAYQEAGEEDGTDGPRDLTDEWNQTHPSEDDTGEDSADTGTGTDTGTTDGTTAWNPYGAFG